MDVDYEKLFESFSQNEKLNQQLSGLIDEANHVHFSHPEIWKREGSFKDYASSKLARLIREDRALTRKFLDLKDRTLSMLVYRAIELLDSNADIEMLSLQSNLRQQ